MTNPEIAEIKPLTCKHFRKDPNAPECCPHCHHDDDGGFDKLMSGKLPDGTPVYVCCKILEYLGASDKRKKDGYSAGGKPK